jgi:hypothetical protein
MTSPGRGHHPEVDLAVESLHVRADVPRRRHQPRLCVVVAVAGLGAGLLAMRRWWRSCWHGLCAVAVSAVTGLATGTVLPAAALLSTAGVLLWR